MRSVTFETAGIAAAVAKAARVAPSKGMAFDKVAGIMMEIDPTYTDHHACTIRATNLEVDYLEWVRPIEIKGDDPWSWRMPSLVFSGFMSGLPIGAKSQVTITEDEDTGRVILKSGRRIARISPIMGDSFKSWEPYDASDLKEVTGLASRITQASWATDPEAIPFSGIHINGKHIFATDRYRMVRIPCEVPIARPVTVPLDTLAPILKSVEDVRLGVDDRSLMLMPDEYTQMRTVIYDAPYPEIERAMWEDMTRVVKLPRQTLRDTVASMTSLVGRGERYPRIALTINPTGMILDMEVESVGSMTDEVAVLEYTTSDGGEPEAGEETVLYFTPTYLTDALDHTRAPQVTLGYRPDQPYRSAKISDGEGFDAWLMPRKLSDPAPIKKDDDDDE